MPKNNRNAAIDDMAEDAKMFIAPTPAQLKQCIYEELDQLNREIHMLEQERNTIKTEGWALALELISMEELSEIGSNDNYAAVIKNGARNGEEK